MKRWICTALSAALLLLVPLSGFGADGTRISGRHASGTYHVENFYLVDDHTDGAADEVHATFDLHEASYGYPNAIRLTTTDTTGCTGSHEVRLEHSVLGGVWFTLGTVDSTTPALLITDLPLRYLRGVVEADADEDAGCTNLDVVVTFYWQREN